MVNADDIDDIDSCESEISAWSDTEAKNTPKFASKSNEHADNGRNNGAREPKITVDTKRLKNLRAFKRRKKVVDLTQLEVLGGQDNALISLDRDGFNSISDLPCDKWTRTEDIISELDLRETKLKKYNPETEADLLKVMNKGKLLCIKQFLIDQHRNINDEIKLTNKGIRPRKIMILTGPSGCGKSAALNVFSSTENINLRRFSTAKTGAQPGIEDLEQFLLQASYKALDLSKLESKSLHSLLRKLDKSNKPSGVIPSRKPSVLVVENINDFFITNYNRPIKALPEYEADDEFEPISLADVFLNWLNSKSSNINEIAGVEASAATRLVICYTSKSSNLNPKDLERVFSEELLMHPNVMVCSLPSITEKKIFKRLKEIIPAGKYESIHQVINNIASKCNGDLNQALQEFQVSSIMPIGQRSANSSVQTLKDEDTHFLYAVAKIIRAKPNHYAVQLEFNADKIGVSSGLDPITLSSFCHVNFIQYFIGSAGQKKIETYQEASRAWNEQDIVTGEFMNLYRQKQKSQRQLMESPFELSDQIALYDLESISACLNNLSFADSLNTNIFDGLGQSDAGRSITDRVQIGIISRAFANNCPIIRSRGFVSIRKPTQLSKNNSRTPTQVTALDFISKLSNIIYPTSESGSEEISSN